MLHLLSHAPKIKMWEEVLQFDNTGCYITGMYTRFPDIVNNLKNLSKVYTDADLYKKILRSLLRTWDSKVITIQEAIDLSILKVEELVGSLMTYEISLYQHKEEVRKKNYS